MTTPRRSRRPERRDEKSGLSDRAANWIIGAVAAVWVGNMTLALVSSALPQMPDYSPPEYVNGTFLAVVGVTFIARNRGKDQ